MLSCPADVKSRALWIMGAPGLADGFGKVVHPPVKSLTPASGAGFLPYGLGPLDDVPPRLNEWAHVEVEDTVRRGPRLFPHVGALALGSI
jgi:hypothetical protein